MGQMKAVEPARGQTITSDSPFTDHEEKISFFHDTIFGSLMAQGFGLCNNRRATFSQYIPLSCMYGERRRLYLLNCPSMNGALVGLNYRALSK
jgi:hypothetical protein